MTTTYYDGAEELRRGVQKSLLGANSILDVGCGLNPQDFLTAPLHLLVEPYSEYVDILRYRFDEEPNYIILQGMIDEVLPFISEKSIDTVFLLDLIEHLEKEQGWKLLEYATRIARKQVVLFTPLGFMPQEYEQQDLDGWGLGNVELQEHLSGWTPEEFPEGWEFHVCKTFHKVDADNKPLEEPFGAFYGVLNIDFVPAKLPERVSSIGIHNLKFKEIQRIKKRQKERQDKSPLARLKRNMGRLFRGKKRS